MGIGFVMVTKHCSLTNATHQTKNPLETIQVMRAVEGKRETEGPPKNTVLMDGLMDELLLVSLSAYPCDGGILKMWNTVLSSALFCYSGMAANCALAFFASIHINQPYQNCDIILQQVIPQFIPSNYRKYILLERMLGVNQYIRSKSMRNLLLRPRRYVSALTGAARENALQKLCEPPGLLSWQLVRPYSIPLFAFLVPSISFPFVSFHDVK